MTTLSLNISKEDHSTPVQFQVKKMINAGYVGRDTQAVQAHIEELRREGVPPPPSVPMIFPVLGHNITTSGKIDVLGSKTSGEAEYVILLQGDRILVGLGSDHTDRELEVFSIVQSKQVCPNVMSEDVWDYDDVKDHWDDLLIQSWTRHGASGEEILYQEASLGSIISCQDLLALVRARLRDGHTEGLVIFSGTIPILPPEMMYGDYFRSELTDLHTGGSLACEYRINRLDYLKDESDS